MVRLTSQDSDPINKTFKTFQKAPLAPLASAASLITGSATFLLGIPPRSQDPTRDPAARLDARKNALRDATSKQQRKVRFATPAHPPTKTKQADSAAGPEPASSFWLPRWALGLAATSGLAYLTYHLSIIVYLLLVLKDASADADFARGIAITDELRDAWPHHFEYCQVITRIPIPNYPAARYYEEQRDFFMAAASEFELHPYWAENTGPEQVWRGATHERVKSMLRQLESDGRRDYALEKDRCVMHKFLSANNIPMCSIEGEWRSLNATHEELDAVMEAADKWPVFIKACHLTQHSSQGTRPVKSLAAYREQRESIHAFLDAKWDYRSHDVDRVWEKEGDIITSVLDPGFLVQSPMTQPDAAPWSVDGRVSVGLVEIRAEVIWGKVYLMHVDATYYFKRDGTTENYAEFTGAVLHQPNEVSGAAAERVMWIQDEGYLKCVVDVSERLAHAAHIEYLRVDVFLSRGNPNGCVVNEISLTSGYPYFGHEDWMAKIWTEPLRTKQYKLLNSTEPVYELSSAGR